MNWEAINAIAQAIGAFGVVASLFYLGVQVHRSTRVAKIAAQDSAASALRDVTKPYMENAELARIWQVGLENLNALNPADQSRFFHASYQFLKAFETIHFHYAYGLLDLQLWAGWLELLRHYIASPGMGHYWGKRHDLFSERFQEFVKTLEPPSERFTVGTLLGDEKIDPPPPKRQSGSDLRRDEQ
jgi:hypothetical protein